MKVYCENNLLELKWDFEILLILKIVWRLFLFDLWYFSKYSHHLHIKNTKCHENFFRINYKSLKKILIIRILFDICYQVSWIKIFLFLIFYFFHLNYFWNTLVLKLLFNWENGLLFIFFKYFLQEKYLLIDFELFG